MTARTPAAFLLVAVCGLAAGCPSSINERASSEDSGGDNDGAGGAGSPGNASASCAVDADCVAAGPRCCDCPTHAVSASDPAQDACMNVDCGPAECGSPMQAACRSGSCVLECAPVACAGDISCPMGFATDGNGCLTCACAAPTGAVTECSTDSHCARVREDCCGCENGGSDTAVPTGAAADHEAGLMCPANPTCPGGDTCVPELAARCVQGGCSLVAGPLPADACGRGDLPTCPAGDACTVNASDPATMHGVGICQP